MPNAKLYVDQSIWPGCQADLTAALAPMRAILCRDLAVPAAACQLAIVPVWGLADQPAVNVELSILPRPERTGEMLRALGAALQGLIGPAAGGVPVAVRISQLDPETYVALK